MSCVLAPVGRVGAYLHSVRIREQPMNPARHDLTIHILLDYYFCTANLAVPSKSTISRSCSKPQSCHNLPDLISRMIHLYRHNLTRGLQQQVQSSATVSACGSDHIKRDDLSCLPDGAAREPHDEEMTSFVPFHASRCSELTAPPANTNHEPVSLLQQHRQYRSRPRPANE